MLPRTACCRGECQIGTAKLLKPTSLLAEWGTEMFCRKAWFPFTRLELSSKVAEALVNLIL